MKEQYQIVLTRASMQWLSREKADVGASAFLLLSTKIKSKKVPLRKEYSGIYPHFLDV
jgi:hypothetical protein